MFCKEKLDSIEKLDNLLAIPHSEVIEMMKRLSGDIMILGIAGKMGVTMGMQAINAIKAANVDKKVYYEKYVLRDKNARMKYSEVIKNQCLNKDDIFIMDILRRDNNGD